MRTLGFVGAGTIASAFIAGLRAAGKQNPVVVSPRSESTSMRLAADVPGVRRAASNAEVVAGSDIVFLAMRPAQVEEALDGIGVRGDRTVCSFVTGLPLRELTSMFPASTVCRVLPLPAIAFGKGPVILFPRVEQVFGLLQGMGSIVLPRDEGELVTMGGVSGAMSTFFEIEATLSRWLVARGVEGAAADLYVRAIFSGLAETALRSPADLAALALEHQTKGGLNQRTRDALLEAGWFGRMVEAIEGVGRLGRQGLE